MKKEEHGEVKLLGKLHVKNATKVNKIQSFSPQDEMVSVKEHFRLILGFVQLWFTFKRVTACAKTSRQQDEETSIMSIFSWQVRLSVKKLCTLHIKIRSILHVVLFCTIDQGPCLDR